MKYGLWKLWLKSWNVNHKSLNRTLTDTGRLIYETEIDSVYEDFYEDKSLLDFSNYCRDSWFYDPINKKVIAKMKVRLEERLSMSLLD